MSSANPRVSKRHHYACDNCRRKKTRCPGERPYCSMCTRLRQVCRYTKDNEPLERPRERALEDRLEQLEERLDLLLERPIENNPVETRGSTARPTTPSRGSSRGIGPGLHEAPGDGPLGESETSRLMPPKETIVEGLDLYFQYCHMQPLWLFDREDVVPPEKCHEEVIFSILALAMRFSTRPPFDRKRDQICRKYAESARGYIMLRIARGEVQLPTIQSLCLLALANFVANETQLAWLHIGLATSLNKCGGLDVESHREEFTIASETRRRVFWSIHMFNELYGPCSMQLNMLDIYHPKYVAFDADISKDLGKIPPLAPREAGIATNDIWLYMVQMSTVWRQVQHYVSHCASGNSKPPWSLNSSYSAIAAHLMDLETNFPNCHRYDSVGFIDQSWDQLHRNRAYWSPWLYIQFSYHAVHSMLNHPFLYSWRPQQSAQLAVPNTFWKTCSELALIHTTWIARLADMVSEKQYKVSDPFLGYCVAIAATIHIYYCRAADSTVREAAHAKLNTCLKFLAGLATVWPRFQETYQKLEALLSSAFTNNPGANEQQHPPRKLSINTSLMWSLLHNVPTEREGALGSMIFHPSFFKAAENEDANDETVETEIFHNSTRAIDTVDGGQEFPPYSNPVRGRTSAESQSLWAQPAQPQDDGVPSSPLAETATWPGTGLRGDIGLMNLTYDPFFQFQDDVTLYPGTWEIGNL